MDLNHTPPQPPSGRQNLLLGEGPVCGTRKAGDFSLWTSTAVRSARLDAFRPMLRQSWKMPERVGWLIPRKDGDGFMAGFQSGIVRL